MSPDTEPVPEAVADAESEPKVPVSEKKPRSRYGRLLDLLAVAIVLYAVFHFLVQPRLLATGGAVAAPPVALAAMDGSHFDLAAHKGRVVFLDFWASWCEPCKMSLPLAEHFAATHPEVDVIAVDSGELPGVARAYAAAHDMRNVVFDPDQSATHAFAIDAYPTMMVIDPTGRVQAKWLGYNPALEANMAAAADALGAKKKRAS
jgi:thiol-disulfide isomerase/thioredoxin